MAASSVRTSKITIRQPLPLKRKIQQAAAKRGMTVTSFINGALERIASRTLARVRRRELSRRDQQLLLDLLSKSRRPSQSLVRAAKRYRTRYGD